MKRLRVAWFSDLGLGSSSTELAAYCSRLLLPELSKHHTIELFSPSFSPRELELPHHHYLNAYKRHREEPFDVFFYQLEDTRGSRFVRSHIGLMPGIVWLHDLYFRDLGPEALHTSPWESNIKQFFNPEVPFLERGVDPHQLCPKAYRETSLAPVVLCSSQWALKEFLRMNSSRLEESEGAHIASCLPVPIRRVDALSERSESIFRVACATVTALEGRSHKFLPALSLLDGEWSLAWMVPTGEEDAAHSIAREFGVLDRVNVISGRSPQVWESVVAESDVALHLHTSPFGHLGPYAHISLAYGCPVVVSWSAGGEDFPDDAVFCVAPGLHESAQIVEICRAIKARGASACGREGKRYIESLCEVSRVAERLSEDLVAWAPRIRPVMERWNHLLDRGRTALFDDVRDLIDAGNGLRVSPFDAIVTSAASDLGWLSGTEKR